MAPAAGVTGSLFSLAFDADVRYSGVSIGYTLSQVLGFGLRADDRDRPVRGDQDEQLESSRYLIAVSVISAVVGVVPARGRHT